MMNPNDPNVALVEVVAQYLGDALREQLVFVGGAVAGLLITDPAFIATKLEAFAGRGNNDYLFSHDMGDLIAVIDGRDSLPEECRAGNKELRQYLRDRFSNLLADRRFVEVLPGHLPGDMASQSRLPDLENKLQMLAQLDQA